jgi:hypothetical protein
MNHKSFRTAKQSVKIEEKNSNNIFFQGQIRFSKKDNPDIKLTLAVVFKIL